MKLPVEYPVRVFSVAVDKRGLVIAACGNIYTKTHPTQARWALFANQPERQFLHSEVRTMIKAAKSGKKVSKLVIGRVDKMGNKKDAAPCPVCKLFLETEFPDVEIVYSKEN